MADVPERERTIDANADDPSAVTGVNSRVLARLPDPAAVTVREGEGGRLKPPSPAALKEIVHAKWPETLRGDERPEETIRDRPGATSGSSPQTADGGTRSTVPSRRRGSTSRSPARGATRGPDRT